MKSKLAGRRGLFGALVSPIPGASEEFLDLPEATPVQLEIMFLRVLLDSIQSSACGFLVVGFLGGVSVVGHVIYELNLETISVKGLDSTWTAQMIIEKFNDHKHVIAGVLFRR